MEILVLIIIGLFLIIIGMIILLYIKLCKNSVNKNFTKRINDYTADDILDDYDEDDYSVALPINDVINNEEEFIPRKKNQDR